MEATSKEKETVIHNNRNSSGSNNKIPSTANSETSELHKSAKKNNPNTAFLLPI
jgi:hypothetical protein